MPLGSQPRGFPSCGTPRRGFPESRNLAIGLSPPLTSWASGPGLCLWPTQVGGDLAFSRKSKSREPWWETSMTQPCDQKARRSRDPLGRSRALMPRASILLRQRGMPRKPRRPMRPLARANVFRQLVKRPHGPNPMRDPLVLSGALDRGRAHLRPRARDRREFEPIDVIAIRRRFGQTRRQFALMIGISRETLRNWERGRRFPLGPARALLRIAAADPDVVAAVLVRSKAKWGRYDPEDPYQHLRG